RRTSGYLLKRAAVSSVDAPSATMTSRLAYDCDTSESRQSGNKCAPFRLGTITEASGATTPTLLRPGIASLSQAPDRCPARRPWLLRLPRPLRRAASRAFP